MNLLSFIKSNWLTLISIVCTFGSAYGAYKSCVYYKKSKDLTIFANTNIAFVESQKIISTLTEMLKLANVTKKRGTNYIKEVCKSGESIKSSINKIREVMTVKDFNEIQVLLNSQEIKIERYIDSFITGAVLVDEKLIIDDEFNTCQQAFCEIQALIKRKLEAQIEAS